MIVVYHNDTRVVEVVHVDTSTVLRVSAKTIAAALVELAHENPEAILIWCHINLKEQLNVAEIQALFHHKKIVVSYNPNEGLFLGEGIGYVDETPFIKVNKSVPFPTWQVSSAVGGISAQVVLALNDAISLDKDFDYFLCSLGKLLTPKGLLCYSEPWLLKEKLEIPPTKASTYTLFRFVKQHCRTRWVFLLLLNMIVFEQKFPVLPFLFSFFYKNRTKLSISLDAIKVQSSKKLVDKATVDVVIPTIGRKNFLYDVLKDLKAQTHLPTCVIVVEQNPEKSSASELDYLKTEEWPFEIKHTFTHQTGACNARNIALKQINSEWVFLADDDIRIAPDFIQKIFETIRSFGIEAVTLKCFQQGQKSTDIPIVQWETFGAGCSFVYADSLAGCSFKKGYEFGFGEDGDFGMQLRNKGYDILYLSDPKVLHLKAPIGGFRTKPVLQWQEDNIQPRPSPTVMLYQITHLTDVQLNSYRTTILLKNYNIRKIKNPVRYYTNFQKQWERSMFWAKKLKQQNEI